MLKLNSNLVQKEICSFKTNSNSQIIFTCDANTSRISLPHVSTPITSTSRESIPKD